MKQANVNLFRSVYCRMYCAGENVEQHTLDCHPSGMSHPTVRFVKNFAPESKNKYSHFLRHVLPQSCIFNIILINEERSLFL